MVDGKFLVEKLNQDVNIINSDKFNTLTAAVVIGDQIFQND